jgi:hypothetical protein
LIRARLKKRKQLKLTVGKRIGKAFDSDETERLSEKAKVSRSPHMYPAFMLARNAGMSAGVKIGHRTPRERCFAAE